MNIKVRFITTENSPYTTKVVPFETAKDIIALMIGTMIIEGGNLQSIEILTEDEQKVIRKADIASTDLDLFIEMNPVPPDA